MDGGQEVVFTLIFLVVLLSLLQLALDLDHFLLQELDELGVLGVLLLFLRVEGALLGLLCRHLQLLQLPLLLREDVVVVLVLELELVELLDAVLDDRLLLLYALLQLVVDVDLIHALLDELDHEISVLDRPLVEHLDGVEVDGLIEDHVLDLPLGLADKVAQLVVVEEEKLKFDAVILHELDIVLPVNALFAPDLHQRTVGPDAQPVFYLDESITHEDFAVLFL